MLTVASFNVNSIRVRMPIIQKWVEKIKPDVLCLQETKVPDDEFPVQDIDSMGYHAVFSGEKSYNGVAIIARHEMHNVRRGFDGKGAEDGSRLLIVTVCGVDIVNTYVPQGTALDSEKFVYKLKWFDRLLKLFQDSYENRSSLIWAGDFNVAPLPIDVHNPKKMLGQIGYHPDEHKALARVMEWGFTDVFRKHKPEAGNYSFWDYRVRDAVKRGLGWRVDHIWSTQALAEKSVNAWIDPEPRSWERPSDHTPIVAQFNVT